MDQYAIFSKMGFYKVHQMICENQMSYKYFIFKVLMGMSHFKCCNNKALILPFSNFFQQRA
jgi:hypothetical protein